MRQHSKEIITSFLIFLKCHISMLPIFNMILKKHFFFLIQQFIPMKTLMDEIKSCLVIYYLKGYKYVLVVSFWKIHHMWSRDINLVSSFLCSPSSSQSLSYTLLGNPRKTHFFFLLSVWPACFLLMSSLLPWHFICSSRIRFGRGTAFQTQGSITTSPFPTVI